jgi:hypothetical protein
MYNSKIIVLKNYKTKIFFEICLKIFKNETNKVK